MFVKEHLYNLNFTVHEYRFQLKIRLPKLYILFVKCFLYKISDVAVISFPQQIAHTQQLRCVESFSHEKFGF